ncbi:GDP-mannose 4,6-dehydratase [Pseudogemmatithrix spongiicola]|uniref:GDP-mannose 4,6-dehydratase n=1 Tax=Pseudogemmatithrix spongiicola TaxID=3062599 RepID=A0AA49JV93_9BACT|nr:GDP-mannose 4,6-dehydratase [Gemmatimonadaceae bacterium 'strain 138']WKW15451.1 GDP-mannose 4,6-dehydratase [Gemmatimonadaceae bacterium 'strain 318']
MRALVTGAAGFVGQWTSQALLRDGWAVTGAALEGIPSSGTLSADNRARVEWIAGDLRDDTVLERLLDRRPDAILHLAGIAFQPAAGADEAGTRAINVGIAARLLTEIARRRAADAGWDPTILVIGSGEEYGRHEADEFPLPETAALRPATFYAATKVEQERLALEAHARDGLRVICTRAFNHSGPGQAASFLLPSLVQRAREARRTGQPVRIGNTDVTRDFLHVSDVVSAYISLVSRGQPGEVYNVCSAVGVRVGDLAAEVLAAAGVRSPLEVDPALQRAVDVPVLVGDNAKLRAATGWTPVKSRSDIIQDLLDAAS